MRAFKTIAVVIVCLLALFFTFFHFDYQETPYPDVYFKKVADDKFELAFIYKVEVSGNMHGPSLPFRSSTHDRAKWFYVDRATGVFDANSVVLVNYRLCNDPFHSQKNMRGTLELSKSQAIFALEMPRYTDAEGNSTNTVQRYVNWEHNGRYNLINERLSVKGLDGDYRPSSCDPTVDS